MLQWVEPSDEVHCVFRTDFSFIFWSTLHKDKSHFVHILGAEAGGEFNWIQYLQLV